MDKIITLLQMVNNFNDYWQVVVLVLILKLRRDSLESFLRYLLGKLFNILGQIWQVLICLLRLFCCMLKKEREMCVKILKKIRKLLKLENKV